MLQPLGGAPWSRSGPSTCPSRVCVSLLARPRGQITATGTKWLTGVGIEVPQHGTFRLCMDGTERRPHFAGPTATALLKYLEERKFVVPDRSDRRALQITDAGRTWFADLGINAEV